MKFPLVLVDFYVLATKYLLSVELRTDIINSVLKSLTDQWSRTPHSDQNKKYAQMSFLDYVHITDDIRWEEDDPLYKLCMDIACISIFENAENPGASGLARLVGTTSMSIEILRYNRECMTFGEELGVAALTGHKCNALSLYTVVPNYTVAIDRRYRIGFLTRPAVAANESDDS